MIAICIAEALVLVDRTAGFRRRLSWRSRESGDGRVVRTVRRALLFVVALFTIVPVPARAAVGDAQPADPPQQVVHRVTGLFSPDREADLRKALEKVDGIRLVSIDFDHAEATFEYSVASKFPNATPEQVVERFNEWLRNASNHTLGIKAVCAVPRDKLTRIEISVGVLDCDACCLAVYEILAQQEGVEQAMISVKDGRATALIDPAKTDKSKLEAALREREVPVTPS